MAGTVVTTEITHESPKKIKFACTTGTGGDDGKADGTTTGVYSGKLILVATVPGEALTADWDVTIKDSDGVDLLAGGGADRNTTATEFITYANLGAVVESTLTIAVTNAGDTKALAVYVYLR